MAPQHVCRVQARAGSRPRTVQPQILHLRHVSHAASVVVGGLGSRRARTAAAVRARVAAARASCRSGKCKGVRAFQALRGVARQRPCTCCIRFKAPAASAPTHPEIAQPSHICMLAEARRASGVQWLSPICSPQASPTPPAPCLTPSPCTTLPRVADAGRGAAKPEAGGQHFHPGKQG